MTVERIHLSDLTGDQLEIAETIGIENYRKLIDKLGGTIIYLPLPKYTKRKSMIEDVHKRFNGCNYKFLANKWGVSVQTIRNILNDDK